MDDLADRSATELARLVTSREVSPVEVVEASLERVERYNPPSRRRCPQPPGLDDAGELELRLVRGEEVGLLAGLPVGIKDVTPVAGLRTTYGSPLYRTTYRPRMRWSSALRDAGRGDPRQNELSRVRRRWEHVQRGVRPHAQPVGLDRSAGGSTGGGAAGLVTGMIMLAEGTDLGGSLRIPRRSAASSGSDRRSGSFHGIRRTGRGTRSRSRAPWRAPAADVALMLQAVAVRARLFPSPSPPRP